MPVRDRAVSDGVRRSKRNSERRVALIIIYYSLPFAVLGRKEMVGKMTAGHRPQGVMAMICSLAELICRMFQALSQCNIVTQCDSDKSCRKSLCVNKKERNCVLLPIFNWVMLPIFFYSPTTDLFSGSLPRLSPVDCFFNHSLNSGSSRLRNIFKRIQYSPGSSC